MPGSTVIATYLHPWEAEIARGLLESEGIRARLADENTVRMDWNIALALGGIRLFVPAESVQAAREVLERQRNGEYEQALENEQEVAPAVCERCGSRSLRATHSVWWILLLVVSFCIAAIFPPPRKGMRCKDCGHRQSPN